jgi:hypothetical protein
VMEMRAVIFLVLTALGAHDLYRCVRQPADELPLRPQRWLQLTAASCGLLVVADLVWRA